MLKLSAFADEIGPDLDEQIRVCKANAVTHFELRGVYGKNVMDFDAALRNEIRTKLSDNGMGVISMKLAGEGRFTERADRQAALKFAFRNAGVDCVTIGFKNTGEIDEAIQNLNMALA